MSKPVDLQHLGRDNDSHNKPAHQLPFGTRNDTENEYNLVGGAQSRLLQRCCYLLAAQEKARHSMEEQTKLVGEKNALIGTVKKLNRDLAKLDSFKRNLLQSLQVPRAF